MIAFGSDMDPVLWPSCIVAEAGSRVMCERCFLSSATGSGAMARGTGAFLEIQSCEMHSCSFAAAASFGGGRVTVHDSSAQWVSKDSLLTHMTCFSILKE